MAETREVESCAEGERSNRITDHTGFDETLNFVLYRTVTMPSPIDIENRNTSFNNCEIDIKLLQRMTNDYYQKAHDCHQKLNELEKTTDDNIEVPLDFALSASSDIIKTAAIKPNRIIAVSAGANHTVGLRSDGTVVATGSNEDGQCDVAAWTDIVAIDAGRYATVGLKSDGTVVLSGYESYRYNDAKHWRDISAISLGGVLSEIHLVGLRKDGTVVATGENALRQCNVSKWKNISAVSAGLHFTVGLKKDGTVVATGDNSYGQCKVGKWCDIVAISAGSYHTVGLKNDGTVVFAGKNKANYEEIIDIFGLKVGEWKNIIAISAGLDYTAALNSDGILAFKKGDDEECTLEWTRKDRDEWPKTVAAISAGPRHLVGLTKDGRVFAVGANLAGRCDVSDW